MMFSGDKRIPMNVSAEADAAFMRELQRSDPERYNRLGSVPIPVENLKAYSPEKA